MADQNQTSEPVLEKAADLVSLYANNVRYETSAWDLKMIFGQLDQSKTPASIEQHTAITMSWAQAKIAAYYLLVNTILHESNIAGKIQIPASVIPQRPDTNHSGLDESSKIAVNHIARIHDEFFGNDPFVPSDTDR